MTIYKKHTVTVSDEDLIPVGTILKTGPKKEDYKTGSTQMRIKDILGKLVHPIDSTDFSETITIVSFTFHIKFQKGEAWEKIEVMGQKTPTSSPEKINLDYWFILIED